MRRDALCLVPEAVKRLAAVLGVIIHLLKQLPEMLDALDLEVCG